MSGFVSTPPSPEAIPGVVAGDGFFPAIDLEALRKVARIDTNVTLARLNEAVVNAMSSLAQDLADWRCCQERAGYDTLAEVPAPTYGDRSRLLALYDRAMAETVAADLAERRRDVGTTAAGHDRADALEDAETIHRRNARWAVRDLQGLPRIVAELI